MPSPSVLFFYCKDGDLDRNNFVSIARTLLAQLLQQDDDLLGYLYEKSCKSGQSCLQSYELAGELLKFALDTCPSIYIVLDGIDECATRDERKVIVNWFREYVENLPPQDSNGAGPDRVHCMFVSQVDSGRKDFNGLANITVGVETNGDDIEEYSRVEIDKLRQRFDTITGDEAGTIVSSVSQLAAGECVS